MNEWTSEWPTEAGEYWLYGRVWSDEEPKLYYVEVRKGANCIMCVCHGNFLYNSDCEDGQWQKITLPDLPT
jgi:hypothetical protein